MQINTPDLGTLRLLGGNAAQPMQQTSSQSDFASILGIANRGVAARSAGDSKDGKSVREDARNAAQEFVAKAFIEPLLKQARESNKEPPPFGPGQGEKQFASLIDAQRSLDLVRSASWPIVDRLTNDLTKAATNRTG